MRARLGHDVTRKRCVACGLRKSVEAFYLVHRTGTARQSRCKPCDNARRAESVRRGAKDGPVDAVRRPDGSIDLVRRP